MRAARLMDLVELQKYDRGEEIRSYGLYFEPQKMSGTDILLNSQAEHCSEPPVTFFDPENKGSLSIVARMWNPCGSEFRVVVLFEFEGDPFIHGIAEGQHEELYIPSYSKATAKKIWQSEPFSGDGTTELHRALCDLRGGRDFRMDIGEEMACYSLCVRIMPRSEAAQEIQQFVEYHEPFLYEDYLPVFHKAIQELIDEYSSGTSYWINRKELIWRLRRLL